MWSFAVALGVLASCFLSPPAIPQTALQTTPQSTAPGQASSTQPTTGATLLQQSLAILTGGTPVNDITLTGTITVTSPSAPGPPQKGVQPGITTESGTITLTAVGDTESQVVITTPSGNRTEVRNIASGRTAEKWTGTDGVAHYNPPDSLLTPHAAWFFPAFMILTESSLANQISNTDTKTQNGTTVSHVRVLQIPNPNVESPLPSVTNQHELYIDPSSYLPVSMTFHANAYPQNAKLIALRRPVPIPEEVHFASYQLVQGRPVPFHIQVYVQNSLLFDITLSSVSLNTGATIPTVN